VSLIGNFLWREDARRVPFEHLGDDGCDGGIGRDNALAVRAQYIEIAEWGLGRPDPLLGFLLPAFASFFRKIVDVVLWPSEP
jgi:hypothetical protein